jgi:hypothetical protein
MAGLAKKVWSSLAAQSDATHSAICVGMYRCTVGGCLVPKVPQGCGTGTVGTVP